MPKIFQIPATISKINTMAHKSLRLHIDTQEEVSPEAMSKLMDLFDKIGWFTFNVQEIKADDLLDLPDIKYEKGEKTKAQRLRAVFYRIWESGNKKMTSEEFYNIEMEKIIQHLKDKYLEG